MVHHLKKRTSNRTVVEKRRQNEQKWHLCDVRRQDCSDWKRYALNLKKFGCLKPSKTISGIKTWQDLKTLRRPSMWDKFPVVFDFSIFTKMICTVFIKDTVAPQRKLGCPGFTQIWSILSNLGSAGDDLRDSGGAENAKNEPVKSSLLPYLAQTWHST